MPQGAIQNQWSGYAIPRPRTGAVGDYFRGLSLIAWFLLLIYSFWWLRDWRDIFEVRERGIDKQLQYMGLGFAILAHLTLGFSALMELTFKFFSTTKGKLLTIFFILMFALAPFSLAPIRSALYAGGTLVALMICHHAWEADYNRMSRILVIAGISILGFLVVLTVHHGLSTTSVGGIQRNRFGQAVLTGVICLFFDRGRLKWAGLVVGIVLMLMVNSRGSMLAVAIFLATYYVLQKGLGKGILLVIVLGFCGVFVVAIPKIGRQTSEKIVGQVLKIHDSSRGIGSGFTGRVEYWKNGLELFSKRPVFGYGFRTRKGPFPENASAHSGYINLLLDAGIVGALMIVAAIVLDFLKRARLVGRIKSANQSVEMTPDVQDTLRMNCIACGLLAAEGMLWLFEPLYLNLGASLLILFFLLLMAPYSIATPATSYSARYEMAR